MDEKIFDKVEEKTNVKREDIIDFSLNNIVEITELNNEEEL